MARPLCRFAVIGYEPPRFRRFLKSKGLRQVSKDPDAVISYGGDGTTLKTEHLYPGVPKICVRDWDVCPVCGPKDRRMDVPRRSGIQLCTECFEKVLDRAIKGDYKIVEEMKLVATTNAGGKRFEAEALNEVQLHNLNPMQAVRFDLYLNGRAFQKDCVSDGVIISTPYGSTGYYYSASGGRTFHRGIGIIQNNPKFSQKPTVITKGLDRFVLRGVVTRTKGLLFVDNLPRFAKLSQGDDFFVRKSKGTAKFIV
jgi:NAD kinase